MKFLRLQDDLLSVLFENEDILAIDKPYGFNSHTNDSKIEHSEFIQDGLIEMYERQWGQKLYIIHRLDQTTTGVMIFGKTPEAAKKYAEFFFNRQVQKTYWFITASKSAKPHFAIDQQIIHKGKELDANTDLSFLKKSESFELWQANPHTGRNHQIRIHAKAAEIPILGDPKYGGQNYPFLCLHNHKIQFPNGVVLQSKPPPYFENLDLLEDLVLARSLFEMDRRHRLFGKSESSDQCFRLAHVKNHFQELEFSIDHYGRNLVLNWYREFWGEDEVRKFSTFSSLMDKTMVVRLPQSKVVLGSENREGSHTVDAWVANEKATRYEIRTDTGQTSGLFLNQRLQRNWVLNNSRNKSVLNLFSSTCGFGVVSALGKAEQVILVESNKSLLAWGKRNFELNGLATDQFRFLCRDSLVFVKQTIQKNIKYDLVICEAPSFFRGEKGIFKIESGLEMLLKSCLRCLKPKGGLLFSTTFEGFFIDDIRKSILKIQKDLKAPDFEINCILPSLDFELPDDKVSLKSFLIRLG